MAKLTQGIREQIVKNIITKTFSERKEEINERALQLAALVYYHVLNKYAESVREGWLYLPSNIVPKMSTVRFKLDTVSICINLSKALPQIVCLDRSDGLVLTERDGEVYKMVKEWHDYSTALTEEINQLKADLRGTLENFTTDKSLLEAWPEVAEFMPVVQTKKPAPLPAITFKSLNARIGAK